MSIISITPAREKLAFNKDNEVYVAITLSAPKVGTKRPPLALSVAMDTSSSMAEEVAMARLTGTNEHLTSWARPARMSKLDVAKYALLKLIDHMTSTDTLSIVRFDSEVTTVLEPIAMTQQGSEMARGVVQRLSQSGMTALCEGLASAVSRLGNKTAFGLQMQGAATRRALLFTDGEANIGGRTALEIESAYRERFHRLHGKDVSLPSISTFGFGNSYNGELLASLARDGGAHYYIKDGEQLPLAFGTELGSLTSIYARDVELEIQMEKGFELLEVLNDLPYNHVPGTSVAQIRCSDLYAEQKYSVVLKVKVPRRKAAKKGATQVMQVKGSLLDVATGGRLTFDTGLSIQQVASKYASMDDDAAVASAIAVQLAAKAQKEAQAKAQRGDFAGAQLVLNSSARMSESLGRMDIGSLLRSTEKGFVSERQYRAVGQKMSDSMRRTFTTQTASSGGAEYDGVSVDSSFANSVQKNMAAAFSITADKTGSVDDMPDVASMVTGK